VLTPEDHALRAALLDADPAIREEELFQLLIREVDVQPFDSASDGLTAEEGVVTTKIRARWYRVRIALYQIPGVALSNRAAESSDNEVSGSPTRIRTWNLPVNSRPLYR
jgi:hypothetical protein